MPAHLPSLLDDETIDALVGDGDVPADARHLSAFVAGVRAVGQRPAPRPSPALVEVLAGHDRAAAAAPTATLRAARLRRRRSVLARVAGAGLVVKIGVGATAAAAGVLGAGALDVLPGAPGDAARSVIEAVTPLDLDDRAPSRDRGPAEPGSGGSTPEGTVPPGTAGEHGDRVSSDATGESDGVSGVDGPAVAETAPGADNRPDGAGPPATLPGPPADTPAEPERSSEGGPPVETPTDAAPGSGAPAP